MLRRTDFRYPNKLEWSVVKALDDFSLRLGRRPVVLSDFRPFDPTNPNSQHNLGRAIDIAWPGSDSLTLIDQLKSARLFSGVGLYNNQVNAQSFHVDTRVGRSVEFPATWGGVIEMVDGARKTTYIGLTAMIEYVKKNSLTVFALIGVTLGLWWLFRFLRPRRQYV
jgi:hypothetical protein